MKKTAIKKASCCLMSILLVFPISGCWDYHGINQTTIVTGIAIDKEENADRYTVTYEVADLTQDIKQEGVKPKIIDAEGKTLFDAARNAKKRIVDKLYFGNTQLIVVDQKIAREGISFIVDWFLREKECRETIIISISQQETAKELLTVKGTDETLVGYELRKIVDEDKRITASTKKVELYSIFNKLREPGISLTVPAFHRVMNNNEPTAEVNGVGVFRGEKLVGFLSPEETNRYLYVVNRIEAGVLTLSLQGKEVDDVSLKIFRSKTKLKCTYNDGRAKAEIRIKARASINELGMEAGTISKQLIEEIEQKAASKLESEISGVIKKVQTEYGTDIFGFGNSMYKKQHKLWHTINTEWDELFRTMETEVKCEFSIVSTSSLIKS